MDLDEHPTMRALRARFTQQDWRLAIGALVADAAESHRDEIEDGVRLAVRLPSDKLSAFQRRYAGFIDAPAAEPST